MRITELELYSDQLPRTMLGKIRRSEVETYLRERQKAIPREEISLTPEEKELMEAPSTIRFLKRLEEVSNAEWPFYFSLRDVVHQRETLCRPEWV